MNVGSSQGLLSVAKLKVLLRTSDASHLEWLREFTTPHFEFQPHHEPHHAEVRLLQDDSHYADLHSRGPACGMATCFQFDSQTVRYPLWHSPSSPVAVFDHDTDVFYEVPETERVVTLISRTSNERVRTSWLRVVRELVTSHYCDAGLLLHAAACVINGRGIIVAAPKSGGKTTLLIHLLRQAAANFLSNDRVAVSFDDNGALLRGIPTVVTIRPGTLNLFPEVRQRLESANYRHRLTLQEAARQRCGPQRPWPDGRIGLSPAQFCQLLATTPVAQARACILLLPVITHQPGGCELRILPPAVADQRLLENLFAARWLNERSELFTWGKTSSANSMHLTNQCRKLAHSIQCLECRLGQTAYDLPNSAAESIIRAAEKLPPS